MSNENPVYSNEGRQVAPLTRTQQGWVEILQTLKTERLSLDSYVRAASQAAQPAQHLGEIRLRVLQIEHAVNKHIDFAYRNATDGSDEFFRVWQIYKNEGFKWRYETIGAVRYDNEGRAEFEWMTSEGRTAQRLTNFRDALDAGGKTLLGIYESTNQHIAEVYDANEGKIRLLLESAIDHTARKGINQGIAGTTPLGQNPFIQQSVGTQLGSLLGNQAVKPLGLGRSVVDSILGPRPDWSLPAPFDKRSDAGEEPVAVSEEDFALPAPLDQTADRLASLPLQTKVAAGAGRVGLLPDDAEQKPMREEAWKELLTNELGPDARFSVRPGGLRVIVDADGNILADVSSSEQTGDVTIFTLHNREITVARDGSVKAIDRGADTATRDSAPGGAAEDINPQSAGDPPEPGSPGSATDLGQGLRPGSGLGLRGPDGQRYSASEETAPGSRNDPKSDTPPEATAFHAGWSLYQSIRGGDGLGIATAGVNAVSIADWYARGQKQPALLSDEAAGTFSTVGKGLGLAWAGVGLYNALDSGEPLGIAYSTASLAQQATQLWASSVNSTIAAVEVAGDFATAAMYAESAALGAAAGALSNVVPILGAALALSQGNVLGAVASMLMMVNPVLGMVVMVLSSIFGGDAEPEYDWIPARGEGSYTRGEDGAIRIEASGTNTHKSIEETAVGPDTEGANVVAAKLAAALSSLLLEAKGSQADEDGPPSLGLIAERLPSLHYLGKNAFVIEFTDPVTGEARQVGANVVDVERLLVEVAHHAEALAPAWEAAQVEAKLAAGDPHAAETDAQYAHRLNPQGPGAAAEDGTRQTLPALLVDLAGDGIATTNLPEETGRTLADLLNGPLRFDVDADGFLEAVEWPTFGDALLALDRDRDGRIDGPRELLAAPAVPESMRGNELLAWLDANADGLLDRRDPAFAALALWIDVNADARSDPGEVLTLGALGVNAVALGGASGATLQLGEGRGLAVHEVPLEAETDGVRTAVLPGGVLVEAENGLDGAGTDARLLYVSGVADLSTPEAAQAWGIDPALATSRGVAEAEGLDPAGEEAQGARATREARRIVLAGAEQGVLFPAVAGAIAALGLGAAQGPAAAAALGAERIEFVLPDGTIVPLQLPSLVTASLSEPRAAEDAPPTRVLVESSASAAEALPVAASAAAPEPEAPTVRSGFVAPLAVSEASVPVAVTAVPIALDSGAAVLEVAAPELTDAPLVSVLAGHEDELIVVSITELLARAGVTGGSESVITWVGEARHGLVGLAPSGEVVFVPEADYFGEAGFSYLLADAAGGLTRAWATISLAPVEDAPIAGSDGILGLEDTALLLDPQLLLANDRDPDGDWLHFVGAGSASHGTLELQADGQLRFTPAENYFGEARFSYLLADHKGNLTEGNVFIALQGVNDAPQVEAIEFGRPIYAYADASGHDSEGNFYGGMSTVYDHAQALALYAAGKALDAAGGPIAASYYQNGTLRPIGFTTEDQHYSDSEGGSYAYDDPMIAEGRIVAYDADGDTLTLSVAAQPVHGSATLAVGDAWRYTSTFGDGYSGADPFVVRVTDAAGASGSGTVSTTHYGTLAHGGGDDGCCPVMLDLDADGVEMIDVDDSRLLRDLDGDGWMERLGWSAEDDALLAYDLDDDGFITRAEEISFVGYKPGARTDLEGLAAFDTDGDGRLTGQDAEWSRFHLWQDRGADGVSAPGELTRLAETDIVAISLASDGRAETRGANILFGRASYERADGSTGEVGDVMFGVREAGIPAAAAPPPSAAAAALEAHFARLALQLVSEMAAFDPKAPAELDVPPSAPPAEAPLAENPLQRQEQPGAS